MSFSKINFWVEGDISTTRIVSRLLKDVAGNGDCHTKILGEIDWASLASSVNIFCRICDPKYSWLPGYLRKNGISYAYYLDDNFWRISGSGEITRHYQSAEVVSALDAFVQGAAFVITHNTALAEFITRRFPGLKCELLPVPFDVTLTQSITKNLVSQPVRSAVVGYAGGYKQEEFALLEQVITQLGIERPEIRFEFIGGVSDRLRILNNVQWFPGFSDYSAFLAFKMSRYWSVGLAPLIDNTFNSSKTNNKFREYGGCKIPGVYSNVSPYTECVRSEESGLLVENNTAAWVEAIKNLVDNSVLQNRIKSGAFDYVQSNCSHESVAPSWREALLSIPKGPRSSLLSCFRFSNVKRFREKNFSQVSVVLESAGPCSILWLVLKLKLKSLLSGVTMRRIFMIFILITLVIADIHFIKVALA